MSTNFHNLCHMCTGGDLQKRFVNTCNAICVIVLHWWCCSLLFYFGNTFVSFHPHFTVFERTRPIWLLLTVTLLSGLGPGTGTSLRVSRSAMVADVLIKRVASHSARKMFHINVDSRDVKINCVHVYGHLIRWHFFWKLECLVLWYCVISHTCVNRIKNLDFFHAVY